METRARYALIGLFLLAVIIVSFAFVYWLENKGGFGERTAYQIHFGGSTSGLLVGSSVLFNGIASARSRVSGSIQNTPSRSSLPSVSIQAPRSAATRKSASRRKG